MDIPSDSSSSSLAHLSAPQDAALYQPFVPLFLTTSLELPFPVFARTRRKGFQYACQAGQTVSLGDRDALRSLPVGERFYVLRQDADALLQYQETTVGQILGDKATPIESRCEAFHAHLTALLRLVFQKPTSLHVYRLRLGTEQLVQFFGESSDHRRPLWTLSHRRYTSPTHSLNVGLYGLALAQEYFGQRRHTDWVELALALFLHDIGKTKVRPETLDKSGPLDQTDWREIKQHPGYGQRILETLKVATAESNAVVLQHHERMDGLGYPYALAGRQIHPYARICAIADAFDALTTQRTFRSALNPFDTLRVMKDEMQTQFDPDMFRTFVLMLRGKLPATQPSRTIATSFLDQPSRTDLESEMSAVSPPSSGSSISEPAPSGALPQGDTLPPASRKRSRPVLQRQEEIRKIVSQLQDIQKTIEEKEQTLNAALEKQARFRADQRSHPLAASPAFLKSPGPESETSPFSIPEAVPSPDQKKTSSRSDDDFKLWPADLLDR